MPAQQSSDERLMSAMVWINLLATLAGLLLCGWMATGVLSDSAVNFQRLAITGVFAVWSLALGIGVARFLWRPNRIHAREIALMTGLLAWGVFAAGLLRMVILGRRGGAAPVAIGLSVFGFGAMLGLYFLYLRRVADRLFPR